MVLDSRAVCCTKVNLHEGEIKGTFKELYGLPTYQVGEENGNERVIVILTDYFGYKLKNVNLIADAIAAQGKYHVLIPDILFDDPFVVGKSVLQEWGAAHNAEKTSPIVEPYLKKVKSELSPKFLGGIGYCFGAKFVTRNLTKDSVLDAGASAHPSMVEDSEVEAVAKPIVISCAEFDHYLTIDKRYETEKILSKTAKATGLRFQIDLFSGTEHGFAVRGDLSEPANKYAKEKVLIDQLEFFAQF